MFKAWFVDFEPFGGIMPKEWIVDSLAKVLELHDSKRVPLSSRQRAEKQGQYPYYGATSCMDYVDDYLFDGIYLLLGEDGTVVTPEGYPVLQYVEGQFWVNNHAHILTGKNGYSVEMLYLYFSNTNVQHIVTGAVQPKISQQNLKKLQIIIPSQIELSKFDEIIQPLFAQIRCNRKENENLVNLRDTLLPKLMSGELDVSDIDI